MQLKTGWQLIGDANQSCKHCDRSRGLDLVEVLRHDRGDLLLADHNSDRSNGCCSTVQMAGSWIAHVYSMTCISMSRKLLVATYATGCVL
jgi:hypothetical protein